MAFCRYCGRPLEGNSRFCPSCGAKLEESAGNAAQNTEAAEQPLNSEGYDPADVEGTKVVCAFSYIGILFFLPLVAYPNSRFGKFHANQALVLLIASCIFKTALAVLAGIWWAIPFVPNMLARSGDWLFELAEWALPLAAGIYGFVGALNGKAKEIPLIGKINLINK